MMGRHDRYDSRRDFWRDLVIVMHHPDFEDQKPVEALADLYDRRDRSEQNDRPDRRDPTEHDHE